MSQPAGSFRLISNDYKKWPRDLQTGFFPRRTVLSSGQILCLVSLITIQIEEGNSKKLPLPLTLLIYESCMERSFVSIPIFTTKKQSLSIAISTQLAKAGETRVHQEGRLQLALHMPSASPAFPVIWLLQGWHGSL